MEGRGGGNGVEGEGRGGGDGYRLEMEEGLGLKVEGRKGGFTFNE